MSFFASLLPAVRSQASAIVVFDSRVTINCDRSSSSGATNSSNMLAGLSNTRVRVFDSILSFSTHGRGARVIHWAPYARVPESAIDWPSFAMIT